MKNKKLFVIATIAIVAILSIIVAPSIATGYSVSPVGSMNGETLKAGSSHAVSFYNTDGSYVRLLMYLDNGEIIPVEVYGYFQQNKEGTQFVYSIWIPEEVKTGEYVLHISVQRRAWICPPWKTGFVEGYYGPWEELYPLDHNIVVLGTSTYTGEGSLWSNNCGGASLSGYVR